jgi:hypothetical protein
VPPVTIITFPAKRRAMAWREGVCMRWRARPFSRGAQAANRAREA